MGVGAQRQPTDAKSAEPQSLTRMINLMLLIIGVSARLIESTGTPLDRWQATPDNRRMSNRLKQDKLTGPNGEVVKVNWMPDGRLRLDFVNCGRCVVTKIFPAPKGQTHVELSYGK